MKKRINRKTGRSLMTLLILISFSICYAGGGSGGGDFGGGASGGGDSGGSLHGYCMQGEPCICAVECTTCKQPYVASKTGTANNVVGVCSCTNDKFKTIFNIKGSGGAN